MNKLQIQNKKLEVEQTILDLLTHEICKEMGVDGSEYKAEIIPRNNRPHFYSYWIKIHYSGGNGRGWRPADLNKYGDHIRLKVGALAEKLEYRELYKKRLKISIVELLSNRF